MHDVLLLRFDAPLMSFGGPAVDNRGVTMPFPGRAMLAGLLANALGWHHGDFDHLDALQGRIRYAVRQDHPGQALVDYQTVDLSQDFLRVPGWTTRAEVEQRGGATASAEGTHIRYRHYLADAVYTVALRLEPSADGPSLDVVDEALRSPARPLFLGRKTCLPAGPIRVGRVSSPTLVAALADVAIPMRRGRAGTAPVLAWWPDEPDEPVGQRTLAITDDRDWSNQIHVGRRCVREGRITPREAGNGR